MDAEADQRASTANDILRTDASGLASTTFYAVIKTYTSIDFDRPIADQNLHVRGNGVFWWLCVDDIYVKSWSGGAVLKHKYYSTIRCLNRL